MSDPFYTNKLYPFQDDVLSSIGSAATDLYLTGGTALSRVYLAHRYSDDLDLFINEDDQFKKRCNAVLDGLHDNSLKYEATVASKRFLRIFAIKGTLNLKIDFVNDIAYRYGTPEISDIFPRVDNWRNILSNKLCALSRQEPKDYVDIAAIACKFSFSWEEVVNEAGKKDVWAEPVAIARQLSRIPAETMRSIRWRKPVDPEAIPELLDVIARDVLQGDRNSVYGKELLAMGDRRSKG